MNISPKGLNNKKTLSIAGRTGEFAALYLCAVSLLLVPLYMKTGYFGLIGAKAEIYLRFAIPGAAVGTAAAIVDIFCKIANADKKVRLVSSAVDRTDHSAVFTVEEILLLVILLWKLLVTLFSVNSKNAFLGTIGWHVGSLMSLVLILSTLVIARFLRYRPVMILPVAAVNIWIFVMPVIQSAGIDLFKLLDRIDRIYFFTYLSTIGQKNSFAGYLCLIVPLFWGFYAVCTDLFSQLVYGVLSLLGLLSIILCESDSVYAGIGICALFMLPFFFHTGKRLMRAGQLFLMYGLVLLFVGGYPAFEAKIARMRDFSAAMLTPPCVIGICAVGIFFLALGSRMTRGEESCLRLAAALQKILEVLLIAVIVAVVFYSAAHFDDDWGTRRGLYWRMGWEYYMQLPFRKKLTGIGQELMALVYVSLRSERNLNVIAAHSEPLQILITEGAVGLALYLMFWGRLFFVFLRKKLWEESSAAFFFPLAAYLGQSFFCSVYPVTAVAFSAMAGLLLVHLKGGEK